MTALDHMLRKSKFSLHNGRHPHMASAFPGLTRPHWGHGPLQLLDDGCVDIDSNLVENAIRSPAMNRRNALFAGHDEGGRNWARFASLIGTCKMNGVESYAYLRDLFMKLGSTPIKSLSIACVCDSMSRDISGGSSQMARSDMSDLEWDFIKAVLPNKTRGKKRVDDRRVINGIFYVLRTGIPWADLPGEYGPPTTVYNRFNRWSYAGHWDRIMDAIADAHNVDMVMVDGTSIRAHHAATTLKKRPAPLFRSLSGRIRDENSCSYQPGRVADPV
jgi:transposase